MWPSTTFRPPMSDLSLCWRGLMSISNIGVYDTNVRRLTNPLVSASGAHLTWPPSITKHRYAMSEVSHLVGDRGLVGTCSLSSSVLACFIVGICTYFICFTCLFYSRFLSQFSTYQLSVMVSMGCFTLRNFWKSLKQFNFGWFCFDLVLNSSNFNQYKFQ